MYDTILIPFDGSNEAVKSAEHGIELAASVGATVHAMYVIDLPGAPRTVYVRDDEDDLRQEYHDYGEEVTEEICDLASDAGVDCETVIKTGAPAEEIVEYAEDEELGAIVIGSEFRGKIGALLGGTTDRVVRTSSVPVITTRMTIDE